jgi:hypothetical protein
MGQDPARQFGLDRRPSKSRRPYKRLPVPIRSPAGPFVGTIGPGELFLGLARGPPLLDLGVGDPPGIGRLGPNPVAALLVIGQLGKRGDPA